MDNRFPFHTASSYFHICVRIFDGKTSSCILSSIDLQKKMIFHCFKYISIELESCKFFFFSFEFFKFCFVLFNPGIMCQTGCQI